MSKENASKWKILRQGVNWQFGCVGTTYYDGTRNNLLQLVKEIFGMYKQSRIKKIDIKITFVD